MNTVVLDRQSTSCQLPHASLAILTTDIASFYDKQSTRRLHDQLRSLQCQVFETRGTCHFMAPHHLRPPPL